MDKDLKIKLGASMDVSLISVIALVVIMKQVGVIYNVFQSVLFYTKNVVVLPKSPEKGDEYYGMSPPKLWSSVWQS